MGMDYKHAGCASYSRFDKELCDVAKVFGGVLSEDLRKYYEETKNGEKYYIWGFLNNDEDKTAKFVFPDKTPPLLVRWFNDPYGDYSKKETREIWKIIYKKPEIRNISFQIWDELQWLVEHGDYWWIF